MEVGDHVLYTDEHGTQLHALVTAVHGGTGLPKPSLNIVLVDPLEGSRDSYGQQIKRETSVVHKDQQAAHGRHWEEA